ncbi:hypothetical protein PFICI_05396 [Pestalotiopsis fici W106-1]|uniref:FAD-binding domain-containing protein n=1 Tax=Pestalotiopsis fici (strain W106-1 / CGMCC3.15140) TaxID=1229662 RepID=W3XBU6_PESFW|nr:uncharacterized protein PFICI_05396 [Pestalotiopsis fici W106-1]ETS83520.1 hypothetical protein PFICI_05396 [Pestalotiopsis fici W106-1]
MASINKRPHVLIIGAGLGGLTLAQCLRKQGITFDVFERDNSEQARSQGWAIGLHTILKELENAVPSDLPNLRKAVNHLTPLDLSTQICFYTGAVNQRVGVQDTPETPCLRANRPKLRQWLATDIPIQWSKHLVHIDNTDAGQVTVEFADGTCATGDVVVGADGVNSTVREHLMQRSNHEVLNIVPTATIIGDVKLSGAAMERQLSLGHSCYIASPGVSSRTFVGLQQVAPDGQSGDFYWFHMEDDADVGTPGHWLRTASRKDKLAYVQKALAPFDPQLREIVELTTADGIRDDEFVFRDSEMISSLPRGSIALLGDAIHPMTPYLPEMIAEYHEKVTKRGAEAVRKSRNANRYDGERKVQMFAWGSPAVPLPLETIVLSEHQEHLQ